MSEIIQTKGDKLNQYNYGPKSERSLHRKDHPKSFYIQKEAEYNQNVQNESYLSTINQKKVKRFINF